jgi:hypothetical protein
MWSFFHCDENLNVTILVNIMTQTSHMAHDIFKFLPLDPFFQSPQRQCFICHIGAM